MKIVHGREGTASEHRTATFTGEVYADPVLKDDGVNVGNVFFAPGARTYWHSHDDGQVLHVREGAGFVCAEGGERQNLEVGDTVWAPPGEVHWHGGRHDSYMLHTAVSLGTTQWHAEVTDEEYGEPA